MKSKGATIHLHIIQEEWGGRYDIETITEMNKQWDYVEIIPPSEVFKYKPKGEFYEIDEWWDKNIEDYIRLKLTGVQFDVCIVNYTFFF